MSMKNKKIKDIHKEVGEPVTATHVYDPHIKKVYDVETHRHLLKIREDMAADRPVWIPKSKRSNPT
jgi:hypothetical protein